MKKPMHDRIYLLPEDGVWCWADRPAPGVGQSNDDAAEYVRADLFDQVTAQRDSATSQLETARTAINNNFNQLREHADKIQAERDNAWQELREIREAIGANPEESTADEVRRVVAERDKALAQSAEDFGDGYYDGFIDGAKHQDDVDLNTKTLSGIAAISDEAMRCSEIAEGEKSKRVGIVSRQELTAKNTELVAQVEALTGADVILNLIANGASENPILAAKGYQKGFGSQCLRDIQAEAGRAGVLHMHNMLAKCYAGYGSESDSLEAVLISDQYAASVRVGE